MKKTLGIIVIAIALLVGGCFVKQWYGWHRMKTGYVVEAEQLAPYLQVNLKEDLGYDEFDPAWLQAAWVNGFQDHTYLFVVKGNSDELRKAIEKSTSKEAIQRSFFSNGNYLGPSTAPDWWDTSKIDVVESRYLQKESNHWRFTWIDDRLYIVYCSL